MNPYRTQGRQRTMADELRSAVVDRYDDMSVEIDAGTATLTRAIDGLYYTEVVAEYTYWDTLARRGIAKALRALVDAFRKKAEREIARVRGGNFSVGDGVDVVATGCAERVSPQPFVIIAIDGDTYTLRRRR